MWLVLKSLMAKGKNPSKHLRYDQKQEILLGLNMAHCQSECYISIVLPVIVAVRQKVIFISIKR